MLLPFPGAVQMNWTRCIYAHFANIYMNWEIPTDFKTLNRMAIISGNGVTASQVIKTTKCFTNVLLSYNTVIIIW